MDFAEGEPMKRQVFLILIFLCAFAIFTAAEEIAAKTIAAPVPIVPKRVEVDRNYDELPDRFEHYNADGTVDRIETDTDFNGKIDEWVYYKNGIVEKAEKDTNGDGKADTWMKY